MEISVLSIFFIIFFFISPISIKSQVPSSRTTTTHCSHGSPKINLPFNFNLSCSSNTIRIHFKTYDSLAVKSVSYDDQQNRLDLVDLNGCVHAAFLELNLSATPFRYYYAVKDYSYLNCTARLSSTSSSSSMPIPCMSRPGNHYVYVVKAALVGTRTTLPRFCKEVKRVRIPFEYSPYLDDGSFGLALTWGFDHQTKTESQTNYQVLSISLVVAMVAIISMVAMKIYDSKEQKYGKEEEAEKKLFKDSYEALKTGLDEPLV